MKTSTLLLTLVVAGILAPIHAETEGSALGSWTASHTVKVKDQLFLDDRVNKNDLEITGLAKIVEEADLPGGKALEFSGEQTLAASVRQNIQHGLYVKLTCLAKLMNRTEDATLLNLGAMELRHLPKRGKMSLIIWYNTQNERKFVYTDVPVALDKWVSINALVRSKNLVLIVDDKKSELQIPDEAVMDASHSKLRVGYGNNRPFIGLIDKIELFSLQD